MNVLQELINAIGGAVLLILVTFLVNLIRQVTPQIVQWLNTKFTKDQLDLAKKIIDQVVQATEQKYSTGELGKFVTSKKDFAIKMIEEEFKKKGIPFDIAAADRMIESAINQGVQDAPAKLAVVEGLTPLQPAELIPVESNETGSSR